MLARLHAAKGLALHRKQTVNWKTVERDWEEYFDQFAADEWREEFIGVIEGVITDQGERWNAEFGMQFSVRNLFAEEWFEDYMAEFSEPIIDTTRQDVSLLLKQAQENGWGVDEMSTQLDLTWDRYLTEGMTPEGRRLTDEEMQWFLDRNPRYRRDMIARTETIKASNAGSQALFVAWGVVEQKEWLATGDDRTRTSHLQAWSSYSEGGTPGPIALEQQFRVGGASLMFPGDPSGPPGELINCRCVSIPFFADLPSAREDIDRTQALIEDELRRREQEPVVIAPQVQQIPFSPSQEAIQSAEEYGRWVSTKVAKANNITAEEVFATAQRNLETAIGDRPIAIRAPVDAARSIIEEGRWKSQFETGTSGGWFKPNYRAGVEKKGLGVPVDIEPKLRPIYGYVQRVDADTDMYGEIEFVLKKNVRNRTSITLGDSLHPMNEGYSVGTPMLTPRVYGFGIEELYNDTLGPLGYIETQIYGGVSIDDVAQIIVHNPSTKAPRLRRKLDDFIEWAKDKLGKEVTVDSETW